MIYAEAQVVEVKDEVINKAVFYQLIFFLGRIYCLPVKKFFTHF